MNFKFRGEGVEDVGTVSMGGNISHVGLTIGSVYIESLHLITNDFEFV